jgi:hypothetical protein
MIGLAGGALAGTLILSYDCGARKRTGWVAEL